MTSVRATILLHWARLAYMGAYLNSWNGLSQGRDLTETVFPLIKWTQRMETPPRGVK